MLGGFGTFQDVVETDDGIFAVGSMGEMVDDVPVLHAAIWRSQDGVTWERVLTGEASTAGESDVNPEVLSIASDQSGRLVAVGTTVASDGRGVAAVWVSDDGRLWERAEPDATVFESVREGGSTMMFGVTYGPDGWVAVGSDAYISAAVWTSIDGTSWIRIDESTQPFGAAGSLKSVTALPRGYVAVGPMGFYDVAASEARMWISADGENWRRALNQRDGYVMGIAVNGDVAVMTGAQMGDDGDYHATIWSGPVFDPLNPPPDPGPSPTDQRYLNGSAPLVTLLAGETCDDLATVGTRTLRSWPTGHGSAQVENSTRTATADRVKRSTRSTRSRTCIPLPMGRHSNSHTTSRPIHSPLRVQRSTPTSSAPPDR